jgi:putative PIN family toxin of toxin-antitoxin system
VRRAVLDTNVIVSGSISPTGSPRRILIGWRLREFDLVISPAILDEVARTLLLPRIARRYHVTAREVTELGRLLTTRSIVLTGVPPIPPTVRDLTDDHILALAVAGHADHIVSGDDDRLSLRRYAGIPLLRPAMYARLLEEG